MTTTWQPLRARIPGRGQFVVTADAVEMISAFGGTLHCYDGSGGCRKKGLYFSRAQSKKALRCRLSPLEAPGSDPSDPEEHPVDISVSASVAEILDGATLDFGSYTGRQRFAWTRTPALKTPPCTCLRSVGAPAGKRSPCLDEKNIAFSDL